MGTVSVLNVGAGDTKLVFDRNNPAETIRAGRIVKDMLRRGYALLIEVERDGEKKFERALDFKEETCEYIIADFDPIVAADADAVEEAGVHFDREVRQKRGPVLRKGLDDGPENSITDAEAAPRAGVSENGEKGGSRRGRRRGVPASGTRAVAVARSAGG